VEFLGLVADWLVEPTHWAGPDGIPTRMFEHLSLAIAAVLVALVVALPVGLLIGHTGRGSLLAINLANVARAVPSYALMVLVLPATLAIDPQNGLGLYPTFLAMTVLAIPPILVNAHAGLREVERDLVEAARGMGMRELDVLGSVEIPVALPVIIGGIRTAAVQVVATATLGAVLGYGGLGRYIVDGVARQEFDRLFSGVALVAGLALLTEAAFSVAQRSLTSPGLVPSRRRPVPELADVPAGAAEIGAS
jgi:osmoprotectant transport system permease protein